MVVPDPLPLMWGKMCKPFDPRADCPLQEELPSSLNWSVQSPSALWSFFFFLLAPSLLLSLFSPPMMYAATWRPTASSP